MKANVIGNAPRTAALLLCCTALSPTLAQTPPSAGSLLQEIERDRAQRLPKAVKPEIAPAPKEMKAPAGLTVTVRQFRFSGNRLIGAAELEAVVAAYLNRPLAFAELQKAAAAVAARYRDAGWIVRAYLPQQDIDPAAGIVTIHVVEAVFGKTRLDGAPPSRLKPDRALAYVAAAVAPGEPLNGDAVDRALLLLDDLPGITAAGSLMAGARDGETDLALKLGDEALLSGDVALDNTGSRSTGAERLAANATLSSPMGHGDAILGNLIHSQGSDYGRLAFTFPIGVNGLRLGANASRLDYRLVAPEFAALQGRGNSTTTGFEATYPLVRARLANLYLAANAERKGFRNESGGAVTSDYHVDLATLGLSGNLFDSLGGGGANVLTLAWTGGRVDLAGSPNQAADAVTTRTDGGYRKLRWALSRQQAVTADISLYALYTGQSASKNLDSSEKFYLGGATGVRAYPSSEGGGSEGQMLNLEARIKLDNNLNLVLFHDSGEVRVNRDNAFAGGAALNEYGLRGHGVTLGWNTPVGVNVRLTWARRDGRNPNPTATGSDQDGSLRLDRFWLQAALPF